MLPGIDSLDVLQERATAGEHDAAETSGGMRLAHTNGAHERRHPFTQCIADFTVIQNAGIPTTEATLGMLP
jgi:hypothetical protein